MLRFITTLLILVSANLSAQELYFVDAHSQVDHKLDELSLILKRMNENGVKKTILAPRGKRSSSDIVELASEHPDKIIASIRTKGGAYKKNKSKYYSQLRKRDKSGNYGALAEVILYHAQKGDKAEEVNILPDDERPQAALKVTLKKGWPFVFHIEFQSIKGSQREEYWSAMEAMLKAHPDHPFAIIHMGQLKRQEVEQLINTHSNLYFLTSHADPITAQRSNQPWTKMFDTNHFTNEWQALLTKHPSRFVFALDMVWARDWEDEYAAKIKLWRNSLSKLPAQAAAAIAHGNAERLWSLNK